MVSLISFILVHCAGTWLSAAVAVVHGGQNLRFHKKSGSAVLAPVAQDCCSDLHTDPSSVEPGQHKLLSDCLAQGRKAGSDIPSDNDDMMMIHRGKNCYSNPTVWGPPTWFFLHSMTLALPDDVPVQKQESVKSLMYALQNVLPCPTCGINLKKHMAELPIEPHLKSRDALVKWMVDIHNMVNRDVGHKEYTVDEAKSEFDKAFAKDSSQKYLAVLARSTSAQGARPDILLLALSGFIVALCIRLV